MAARKPVVFGAANTLTEMAAGDAVAILQGGTGANSAAGALANLGAYAASNPAGYVTSAGAPVQSVAGRTGAVTLAVADVSGALSTATAASTYAPIASPSFSGNVTLGNAGAGYINIGATGAYVGSNVQYNGSGGFKYIASDYAWWWRADGSTGVSFHSAPSGAAGANTADTVAFNVSPTGVVTMPVNPLGVASGGTGAATAAAALASLGAAPTASPTFTGTASAAAITATTIKVGGAAIADPLLPVQINAATGAQSFFAANKNGAYGLLVGYDASANAAVVRNVTSTDPLNLIVNSTLVAVSIAPSGAVSLSTALPVASGGTGANTPSLARAKIDQGVVALTSGTTVATDASLGVAFTITLATSATLANPTNMAAGASYTWAITQDTIGLRTLAYGTAFKFPGGTKPTLSTAANAVDLLTGYCTGTTILATLTKAYA